jgi:hypothetical protein
MNKRNQGAASSARSDEPTARELQANQERLAGRLQAEIRDFESRYELPSAELEAAVERGAIRETEEVATWVIAYRTLRALTDERQTRPQ